MDNKENFAEKSEELKKDAKADDAIAISEAKPSAKKSTPKKNTAKKPDENNQKSSVKKTSKKTSNSKKTANKETNKAKATSHTPHQIAEEEPSATEEPLMLLVDNDDASAVYRSAPEAAAVTDEEFIIPDEARINEPSFEEITFDIPDTTLDELAYDKEPTDRDDTDVKHGFDDFLASYRHQVSEMLKASKAGTDDTAPEDDIPTALDASSDEEDYKIPFPTLNYSTIEDAEDEDDAEQLTIDLSAVPFSPLTESEKKEKKKERVYAYNTEKPGFINTVFDLLEVFIFTVVAVLLVSSFFFRHSQVEGGSMDTTLSDGEHLIISDLFYTPKRGDIIVFEDHTLPEKEPIIKRVIGIEGDTVKVEYENGVSVVYLNGERLYEDYAFTDYPDGHMPGEWTVGRGEVFVLGDHRNVSWDSRSFGTVKVESILGKVVLRFYPFDRFGKVN